MYTIVGGSANDIAMVYIVVIGACILLSPMSSFIVEAISKGLSKWR